MIARAVSYAAILLLPLACSATPEAAPSTLSGALHETTFTVTDPVTAASWTHAAPASVAGGTIDARLLANRTIEWRFSRANCALQDVDTGRPRCGSCDNGAFAGFMRGQGIDVKETIERTTDCIK